MDGLSLFWAFSQVVLGSDAAAGNKSCGSRKSLIVQSSAAANWNDIGYISLALRLVFKRVPVSQYIRNW